MIINSIKIKNNKITCTIDSKEFIISSDTYSKFYLYPNKEISTEEFNSILADSKLIKAKNYIQQLLTKSSYTCHDLKKKLIQKFKLTSNELDEILQPYIDSNIIDDYTYALDYIQSKNNLCYGENYLKEKLIQKGISEEIIHNKKIEEALKFNNQFLDKFASDLLAKNTSLPITKQKQKLSDFLIRRGFDYIDVSNTIKKLNFKTDNKYLTNLNKKINQIVKKHKNKNISKYDKKDQLIQKLLYHGYKYDEFKNLITNIFE